MEIVIDTSDSVPVFAQLIDQIKKAVLSGELSSGAALPSIRQLANDMGLNHNTVAKAYRLLERDAVIEPKDIAVRSSTRTPRPIALSI